MLTSQQHYKVSTSSEYGKSLEGRWHFQSESEGYSLPSKPFDLTVSVSHADGTIEQTTSVEVVDTVTDTPVRLLAIGDSLTRAGVYLNQVQDKLPDITLLGTRVYPGETNPREGRGGWTLDRYTTGINTTELDSPFVFPIGVEGSQYKGNTRDWKNICYENSAYHAYDGFQKIARGWKDEGEYLYDKNGYYKKPSVGDVMLDPERGPGSEWVQWNGQEWGSMAIQPTEFEFDFTKYIERFKAVFEEGTPTHINILLGANDFQECESLEDYLVFIERLQAVIDSIHIFNPNIQVIVCMPTLGPNINMISMTYRDRYDKYDRKMKIGAHYILKAFDNDESTKRNIYIAPMTLTLDVTNGFDFKEREQLVDDILTKVTLPVNDIHPNNSFGQLQMGDTLAAVIQKYRD